MLSRAISIPDEFNARASREKWPAVCDAQLKFDSPRLGALLDIWRATSGARPMPQRGDFTARALAKHLQNLTFVERLQEVPGPRRYRFRLFGSGLARFTGDWTGRFLDEVIPEAFLATWLATYDAAIAMGAPLRFVSRFRAAHLEHIMAESLLAPLCDETGSASGLLISVVYSPLVASTPS